MNNSKRLITLFAAGAASWGASSCTAQEPAAPAPRAPVARIETIAPATNVAAPTPYRWRMANDAAGGNTTGLVIHPLDSNVMYVQSGDTGGYRWDPSEKRWIQFADWNPNTAFGYLTGMAVDPKNKNGVYYSAGHHGAGDIFKSTDGGQTFAASKLLLNGKPITIEGGEDASTLGPRLAVDPNNPNVLFYASRFDGLWRSGKASAPDSWSRVESLTARGNISDVKDGKVSRVRGGWGGITWVAVDPAGGTVAVEGENVSKVIYVGISGDRKTAEGNLPEGGVYRSTDGGQNWTKLQGGPNTVSRASMANDGTFLFTGGGSVFKVTRASDTITNLEAPKGKTPFYAVAVEPGNSQHIVTMRYGVAARENSYSEVNRLMRSTDGGATWQPLKARWNSAAPWWGWFGAYAHWLTFDPNDPKVVWFGDWANPWRCEDISAETTVWTEVNRGKGGSYVLGFANPPAKAGQAIPPMYNVGADWAGFRMMSLKEPPRTHLTQSREGVYDGIADGAGVAFSESEPRFVAVVGGWDHGTNGGGGASTDGGITWTAFEGKGLNHPGFRDSPKLGRIAVGSTVQPNGFPILVWIPRFSVPRYSLDWGKTWTQSKGAPSGMTPSEWDPWQTLAADPIDGQTFYAFDNNQENKVGGARILKSTDGGANWAEVGRIAYNWKERKMPWYHLKAMPGKSGDLWASFHDPWDGDKTGGLYRSQDGGANWTKLAGWFPVQSFAFGAPAPNRTNPALYVAGSLNGKLGIYRSDDATSLSGDLANAAWTQIWAHTPGGEYADAMAVLRGLGIIGADRQQYGRIYSGSMGTGRSVYWGDPISGDTKAPAAPLNLETHVGYGSVRLYWSDPIGTTRYNLYRSTSDTGNGTLLVGDLSTSGYFDAKPGSGTVYYRVEAVNAQGKSPLSAAAAVTPYTKVEPKDRFGTPGNNKETFDKATDGNLSTSFDATAPDGGFTGFDAGQDVVVTRIRFQPRDWQGVRMKGGKFQAAASQNGPWTDLRTVTGEPATARWTEVDVAPANFRFFRYVGPDKGHSNIKEMEFYTGGNAR